MTSLIRHTNKYLYLFLLLAPLAAVADDLADAKAVISAQREKLLAGDVDGLKAGFTDRQKDKIDAAMVKKAQGQLGKTTVDELVAKVEPTSDGGLKVKMANGRTLTTLLKVSGAWKADTLWFK
jgi:hypothetical protein